jgi:hypothetical protein
MGAIDSFISSMNKSEGFARAANYEVVFKFPVGISVPSRGQQLSMHCNTISWPGHDLQVQARKHASEPTRNLVQSHAFEGTIDAIFYLSADHRERFLLEQWQELAVNRYTHKANYYNEYVGAMEIYQLGAAKATRTFTTEGAPIKGNPHIDKEADKHFHQRTNIAVRKYGIEVMEVYPATIALTEYMYESANMVQMLAVTFNYRQHLPININDGNKRPLGTT